jgi:hypothetical protein
MKIAIALVLVGAVASSPAMAQTTKLRPALTGDLKKDLQTDGQNIVTASTVDLTYASKLAAVANTPASAVRKQCWDAIIVINNQASGQNVKDASGAVIPKPDPHAFTDVETLAEVIDNLSPSGPLFTACAGAAQLAKTNVLTFVNAVVTGAAGIAAMPIIPGL